MGSASGPTRTPTDSSYKHRTWYAYITWSTSYINNNQATITVNLYFNGASYNWGEVGKYVSGNIYIEGVLVNSFSVGSQKWSFNYTTSKWVLSGSRTVSRTTAARGVAVSGYVNIASKSAYDSGSAGGSTASGTESIAARPSWQVNYYGNGNTSGATGSQTKFNDYDITLNYNGFAKTGYTFDANKGWNTNTAGTGTRYAQGSTYSTNGALNLYAIWKPNTYTITYNANGGTGTMSNTSVTYDTTVNLPPNTFEREDYLFAGWATNSSGTGTIYPDQKAVTNLTTSGTYPLYATWLFQFVKPNLTLPFATRRGDWNGSGFESDDTGSNGELQVNVEPGKMQETLTSSMEYITTRVFAYYKENSALEYTLIGSQDVTEKTTLTWNLTNYPFLTESQYSIVFRAVPVVQEVLKEGLASSLSTFISSAEFTVDIDTEGRSIGIFQIAPGTYLDSLNHRIKVLSINGDIVLLLNTDTIGTIDEEIFNNLRALGWDYAVDPTE